MKKIGLIVAVIFVLSMLSINLLKSSFETEYESVEIKQDIGGILLCNSVDNSDHQSSNFRVSYKWNYKGYTIDIGEGIYNNRNWNKDEQLIKFNNWLILKTGADFNTDKIFVGRLDRKKWDEYRFTAKEIEAQQMWGDVKAHSVDVCCKKVDIVKIDNGQIAINYSYRTSTLGEEYSERKIFYKLDSVTGKPIINKMD